MFVCMAYREVTHLALYTVKWSMSPNVLLPVGRCGQRCSDFDEHELPFRELKQLSQESGGSKGPCFNPEFRHKPNSFQVQVNTELAVSCNTRKKLQLEL